MIDQFDAGYLRQAALTWTEMIERDDKLAVAVPKMLDGVSEREWKVLIGDEVPDAQRAAAEAHRDCLNRFYSRLSYENAVERNETGGIKMVIRRAMEAFLYRYSVQRIIWKPEASGLTATIRYTPLALWENTTGELRWAGIAGGTGTALHDPENWLIAVSDRCLAKALSICYMMKRLPMQDAINFCQRFGMPAVHGETNATQGTAEWDEFQAALNSFANDLTIVTSLGSKINVMPTSAADGEAVFGWIIEMMNRAMVTLCVGSDLATMSRENGTGASLQDKDADALQRKFCGFISELFQRQLDRRVIEDQFGVGVEPLAYFHLTPPQDEDAKLEMTIDDHVTKYGVRLSPEGIAERYSRVHDDSAPVPTAKALPPAADAANEAALATLEAQGRAAFVVGSRRDLQPLVAAVLPLVTASGVQDSRNAAQTLMLQIPAIEAAVVDGEAANSALEVSLAAEFLRGLVASEG